MAEDQEKARRGVLKRSLTLEIKAVDRGIARKRAGEVRDSVERLNDLFDELLLVHERYTGTLEDEHDISASDSYLDQIQIAYVEALGRAHTWIECNSEQQKKLIDTPPTPSVNHACMHFSNLPAVKLIHFDGDPARYHAFIRQFDECVEKVTTDDQIKMTRLLQYTTGDAHKVIEKYAKLDAADGYEKAKTTLRERFGSDHLVAERLMKNIRTGPAVRSAQQLMQLADELEDCDLTVRIIDRVADCNSQQLMKDVAERLQPNIRWRWKTKGMSILSKTGAYPVFTDLVTFVQDEARAAADPVFGYDSFNTGRRDTGGSNPKKMAANSFAARVYKRPPCLICNQDHRLIFCSEFKGLDVNKRKDVVMENNLCEICLIKGHKKSECKSNYKCSKCREQHSVLIHTDKSIIDTGPAVCLRNITSNASCTDTLMPVVKVSLGKDLHTYALLDTGSSKSFCTESLVRRLRLKGDTVNITIKTLNNVNERLLKVVNLTIRNSRENLDMTNVCVVDDIPVPNSYVDVRKYPHLQDIQIDFMNCSDKQVEILIGQDHAEALIPFQVRRGDRGQPFAIKTLFGWALCGAAPSRTANKRVITNFITSFSIGEDIERLWNIEQESLHFEQAWSNEDKKVIELWDKECKLIDSHYEIPIPWKENAHLPNNRDLAMNRLKSLRYSLMKKGIHEQYEKEIESMIMRGHAEKASEIGSRKIWYLPHHPVVSTKKPGKLRIVFDCAAKFSGESLNDKCHQGPDLINKLLHVLVRFRQYPYAIMADIETMYYQVRIPDHDRDALRFLWFDNGRVTAYRMTSHVFGGIWCACSSTYALRRTVADNEADPIVRDTVMKSFYVDDCLKSVKTVEEALQVVHGTEKLISKGGFNLTKYVVNDDQVLNSIAIEKRATESKELTLDTRSKALGINWNVKNDTLCFDVNLKERDVVSRREMLSLIASIYDPLGLVGPMLLKGKILLQEATRRKIPWDAKVPADVADDWRSWIDSLLDLKNLTVNRCLLPLEFIDSTIELHHFSDASKHAYGSCSYLRCVNKNREVHCILVTSKVKVAPLKTMTIPRLELQAAVMSAHSDELLRSLFEFKVNQSFFWTDSELVLGYIKNSKDTRFQVFIANRVGIILELSNPCQWLHVSSGNNPADIISRGKGVQNLNRKVWFRGPEFLSQYKGEWHKDDDARVLHACTSVEISDRNKKLNTLQEVSSEQATENPLNSLIRHYSSWYKLSRAVSWLLKIKNKLKSKHASHDKHINVREIDDAQKLIIKHVQGEKYMHEISSLKKNEKIKRSSELIKLSPILKNDILRVGGRTRYSDLGDDEKYQIIIPAGKLGLMIIMDHHSRAHLGAEWTLSLVRERYWVINARRIIKKINCFTCRKLFAKPQTQKMADLPEVRCNPGIQPFTYTGMDVFGPFFVKYGRSSVKRYCCLFTCMNTRAVHLEKIDSLEADTFINCLRRFIARRGLPHKLLCDNGTNFIGARTELKESRRQLLENNDKIHEYCLENDITWSFNPPSASHMGGTWERLIRTVRKVLTGLLIDNMRLTDDVLQTFLAEAENIVNNRPITKVSDDPNDMEALTPNHLLLISGRSSKLAPGCFTVKDMYRKRWRQAQYMADQFWSRWIKEYLPELQRRCKWHYERENVQVGDLVLICDDNLPRNLWPIGLVTETYSSKDDKIRSVKVKTRASMLIRPITKIVLLESNSN